MQIVITGTVVVEKDGTEIGRLALATGPTGIGCDPPVPLAPSIWEQRPADFNTVFNTVLTRFNTI